MARHLIAGDQQRHRLAVGESVLAVGKEEVLLAGGERPAHLRRQGQWRGAPGPAAVADIGGRIHPALLGVGPNERLAVADPGPDLQGGAGEEHLEEQHRRNACGGALGEGRLQTPAGCSPPASTTGRWGCTQGRGPLQWHLENVEATITGWSRRHLQH